MAGWWFEPYPSEKWWSSSVGVIVPNKYGKIKNVPNHQPDGFVWKSKVET